MADSQPYYADQAVVYPDNTQALLYFSSQFADRERQKRAQQAAEQKAEQERFGRVQKSIHDDIYNEKYLADDATNPLIRENMDKWAANVWKAYHEQGEAAALEEANHGSVDIASGAQKIKQANEYIIKRAAEKKAQYPSWDGERAINVAHTKMFFDKDENGKWVHKDLGKINPNYDALGEAEKEHGWDFWSDEATKKAWDTGWKAEATDKKTQDATYNPTTGRLKDKGYDIDKFAPRLTDVVRDDKGNYKVQLKSVPYSLDGKNPYTDPATGETIKVLPDHLYQEFSANEAIAAGVEKRVRAELEKAADFKGSGQSNFSHDSEYADMLRKKFMYEAAQDSAKDRFVVNAAKNDEQANMNRIADNKRADEMLKLAKEDNWLARSKFDFDKKKEEKKTLTIEDITPLTVSIDKAVGKDAKFKDGITRRYVLKKDIDPIDYNMVTGDVVKDGETVKQINPIKITTPEGEQEGFFVDSEGNWHGQTGEKDDKENPLKSAIIYKDRVADAQLKYYTKDDLPASSKGERGVIGTIRRAFTPKKKTEKPKGKFDNL